MACSRCQGLMVDEMLFNPSEGVSHTWVPVLRCLNCGNLEDALIRLARGLSGRLGRRTRPGPQRRGCGARRSADSKGNDTAVRDGCGRDGGWGLLRWTRMKEAPWRAMGSVC